MVRQHYFLIFNLFGCFIDKNRYIGQFSNKNNQLKGGKRPITMRSNPLENEFRQTKSLFKTPM
ncbi:MULTISPECIES: hypothetical protein [Vibrio]|uniref:Uncharacterized protein n=1 Tax=Vibrio casei TaxID=673372 RepID=A0A368LNE4_9VIBR|nr:MULTISPECIES: hypothetical protein [Vibrio]RCS73335.1 hypothetical protein CIK83_06740 [Vibrio casei]SJN17792.1 hypothetical protein FM109_01400 [Vibrio casei]HBV75809.1 hypothetical protein [Vibrio sp.]